LAKKRDPKPGLEPRTFQGVAAAPGIAVGPALRLEDPVAAVEERTLGPGEIEPEVERFLDALERARVELDDLREATLLDLGEEQAKIFDVQLMVLRDPLAVDRTIAAIRSEHKNAEFLFRRHVMEMTEGLQKLSDSYFSERAVDFLDVKRRVLRHLAGDDDGGTLPERRGVLLGREIAPSDAVLLDPEKVLGFVTDSGGTTSHAAIMARARGIPGVVGVKGITETVRDGDTVALDGFRGRVELNPTPETLARLGERKRAFERIQEQHAALAGLPAETADGHRVTLSANMEMPAELDYIKKRGAEGIGLFRTEFFFMWQKRAPSEDEQTRVYREVIESVEPDSVVIRALDVGGDKIASYMGVIRERNPFLGMRGIRYLVAHPVLFRSQLRAILRAAAGGRAHILFPMVSSLQEFRHARELIRSAMNSLRRRNVPYDAEPELGVMVEVPSAVMMAEELAAEADFLSVGSNDLIQYLLAIDRDNEALSELYQPNHPAVLRALKTTVEAAHRHGKWVSICGEMAGDMLSVPLLVGLGFDRLSVSPYLVPEVKQTIRSLNFDDCRRLAEDALACGEAGEVNALIDERLGSRFSDLLSLTRETNGKPGRKRAAPARPVKASPRRRKSKS